MTLRQFVCTANVDLDIDVFELASLKVTDSGVGVADANPIRRGIDYIDCLADPKIGNLEVLFWSVINTKDGLRVAVAVKLED